MIENVLVLGSGAREHAIAWKLEQSSKVGQVFVAPGNACKYSVAPAEIPNLNDIEVVRQFCTKHKISMVVIGPEKEICTGWAEKLSRDGCLKVFAPCSNAAHLEASKAFAKEFMVSNGLPTADYATFDNAKAAIAFVTACSWKRIVVKEDGLCGGKGVAVTRTKSEASYIIERIYQINSSASVVLEEFLEGYEVSALCFTDGKSIKRMPLSQDHKRALEGDRGENTGGMGAIVPVIVPFDIDQQITDILQTTITALHKKGTPYVGVLYAGLMITRNGPRILEYNCRFGDPEAQVILRLLNSDLYEIFDACCSGAIDSLDVKWSKKHGVGVVMATQGYPGKYFPIGLPISDIPNDNTDTVTFLAGIKHDEKGQLLNTSGRVLCTTSVAHSPFQARSDCLKAIDAIHFDAKHFRRDIGHFALTLRNRKSLTYAQSGVHISAGNEFVDRIKQYILGTLTAGTQQIGGFGATVDLRAEGFDSTTELVIGMDGIGSKIEIGQEMNCLEGLGHDLVGMCANDVLCHGAKPIAFLDYYVTGKLDKEQACHLVKSIAEGCTQAGCALVGGETAEMPGVYAPNQWDLAGCCVGARNSAWPKLPMVSNIENGDVLLALTSSGLHSNGFSLVRKILSSCSLSYKDPCPWTNGDNSIGSQLLTPTRIYVKELLPLATSGYIKAMAHITGGGLVENLPRVLPSHLSAAIDCKRWRLPTMFAWLQQAGNIDAMEMLRTFNCGVGMVLVVKPSDVDRILSELKHTEVWRIGSVVQKTNADPAVKLENLDDLFSSTPFFFDIQLAYRRRATVAILISGSGSNMAHLVEQSLRPTSNCFVSVVISNKAGVLGLDIARQLGVDSIAIESAGLSREQFEEQVTKELEERGVELICLAGFMRILTPSFTTRWHRRIINIHPSLLPAFKGHKAVPLALEAGVKITGCTVHYTVADVDAGEILGQEAVLVEKDDNEASLHNKIQAKEHALFPRIMEDVAQRMLDSI
ncbi:phosphoribosylglycinamide synthetase, ATP-grasp (A) domain-containing protein [Ditylenchus destructor]|nr:phosphoribosylglycinamide synthetase, ATP-grasp (A) domain-containing protein [Ditylenchus destructor]